MPGSFDEIVQELVAGMTPEERRSLLHQVSGGAAQGLSPAADMFTDMFASPEPDVGPVPSATRGFRLRLDLSRTKPPVWRRLIVPGDLTLDQLHRVIQSAMGWLDGHLHRFRTGSDPRSAHFLTGYDIEHEGEEGIDEASVRLDQLVSAPGDRLWYEYDFGDDWQHVLTTEAVLDSPPDHPIVVAGKRACPPEDCGGVWGYGELAAWVRGGCDPTAVPQPFDTAESARDWLPIDWHPDDFDVAETQAAMDGALAPEIPLPDELMLTKLGLDARGYSLLDRLIRTAAVLDAEAIDGGTPLGGDGAAPEPCEEAAATAVAPYSTLLDVLDGGVRLTSAGYLPPAIVTELAERTGAAAWWIGKMNREDQTYPVHQLRVSARALGLVTVRKGMLAPTAAAKRARREPLGLWRHIARRLPLGRTNFDRQSGWVSLAAVASKADPGQWEAIVGGILTDTGWRTSSGGRLSYLEIQNPTLDAVKILAGRTLHRHTNPEGVDAAAYAARMAIFHSGEQE